MRSPAAAAALPLLAGSAAAIVFYDRLPDYFAVNAAAAALLAFLVALTSAGLRASAGCLGAVIAGCTFAGLSLGANAAERAYHPSLLNWFTSLPAPQTGEPVVLEGTLREDASPTAFGTSLSLDVDRMRDVRRGDVASARSIDGGVRLSVAGTLSAERLREWRAGRRVRTTALLRLPSLYRDPGVADDRRSLARRGVALVGVVKSGALVEAIGRASWTAEAAASARAWIRARLASAVGRWSARSAGVAIAITVGDRTGMSAEDERRLQEAGTYHVIAISGGNIAILAAILLTLLHLLQVPARAAAAAVGVVLLFYAQITGAPASVARAVTAAVVYLAARMLDHRGPPLNALAVAAIVALMQSPLTALDAGFLLSFGATLGILILAPRLGSGIVASAFRRKEASDVASADVASAFRRKLRRTADALVALFLATVCAEIALAPLGALLFLRVTFAGLLLNFAAIPLMTIVQAGSLLVLAATPLSLVVSVSGYVTHVAARWLVDSAGVVDLVPWLSIHVPPPAAWALAVYYGSCVAALVLRRNARPFVLVAALVLAAIVAGPAFVARDAVPFQGQRTLRVVMLDVAQGDATLVLMPDGRPLLVDAGGLWSSEPPVAPVSSDVLDRPSPTFDIGEHVVAPAVRAIGVRRLDTFLLTHGDPDHIGGAAAVMRWFAPRAVWEGVPVPPFEWLALLKNRASASRLQWRNVQAGDVECDGAARIRVLHPPPADWERQRVRNDDSVVLDVRLGGVSIVLPADIGAEAERAVISRLESAAVVVLKVPHHGSTTSSTQAFIDALHPAAAVISSGRDNRFGHPAPLVLARYRDAGIPIFRTDQDGAVFVETDGTTVWIRAWTGRSLTIAADASGRR